MIYTGVGSRSTPADTQVRIVSLAVTLRQWGWTLRSGHAAGADQAFERGALDKAHVWLPWRGYERDVPLLTPHVRHAPTDLAYEIAERFHPAWGHLTRGARALHARNVHEVLGPKCDNPSRALVCYTPDGTAKGGTGQAIRIARAYDVPVFDLGAGEWFDMTRLAVEIGSRR